jgi:signal peptidase I
MTTTPTPALSSKKASTKPRETTPQTIVAYAVMAVCLIFVITFNLQAFAIPSGSMENTLLIGDHLFVNRISVAPSTSWMPLIPYHQVRRGDIIVFLKPGEPGLHLVKRVIGIPGDRLHLEGGVVYINGVRQNEPYVIHSLGNYDPYRDDFPSATPGPSDQLTPPWRAVLPQQIQRGDLIVPANSYFAMGDNRDNSLDSRYWGFVPRENIVGSPLFIYWSFKTPRDEYMKESIPDRIAYAAHVVVHFVDETRWSRMFRSVR